MDWRKRQAIQIAAQLPDEAADARVVLDYARELVDNFLAGKQSQATPNQRERAVVVFPGSRGSSCRAS